MTEEMAAIMREAARGKQWRDAELFLEAVLAALAKKKFMIVFRQESPIGGYPPIMGYSVSIKEVKDAE